MLCTPRLRAHALLAVAAACALMCQTSATPIETNPITPLADVAPLDHKHPAYGAELPNSSPAYRPIVVEEPVVPANNGSTPAPDARRLGASNQDLERLEAYFGTKMERNFKVLKDQYSSAEFSPKPWPSSYWPVFQDGINNRWNANDKCASEKYALAYGLDPVKFMDAVSRKNGILSQSQRRACTSNADCSSLTDGSLCGRRQGESKGFCIPGWFGICHAWAPAAILEPEPKCAVKKGNVTFQPFDIKALLTEIYDGADIDTVFTGARFNGPDEPAKKDQYGRYTDAARRDLGPGFFHIAITNIMGKHKKPFVVDVTAGVEVWNQPVRGYNVLDMDIVDAKATSQKYYKTDKYPFNPDMKKLAYVRTKFSWIVEAVEDGPLVETGKVEQYTRSAEYEYLLELDGNDSIIGGEWVAKSNEEHPDFLWFPTARPSLDTVIDVGLKYKDVRELLDASVKCEDLTPSTPSPSPTTAQPSTTPTSVPTATPTTTPVPEPNGSVPTTTPTTTPTSAPNTTAPTTAPSTVPTDAPTTTPTTTPTSAPNTTAPTTTPTTTPTSAPNTTAPTTTPTTTPSTVPTDAPTTAPSTTPTSVPTAAPTTTPVPEPNGSVPTTAPNTTAPTTSPTTAPTTVPTDAPTTTPSTAPTTAPNTTAPNTTAPTTAPSSTPTNSPSTTPTNAPSTTPTSVPSTTPTNAPTTAPSTPPTNASTTAPSTTPTNAPSTTPTNAPTTAPSTTPTNAPSTTPTSVPSATPTNAPSATPTSVPSTVPTTSPTSAPSTTPTDTPTSVPSTTPTTAPTSTPTSVPSTVPSTVPTTTPSTAPTSTPSTVPTTTPTTAPTTTPTNAPTTTPTSVPSTVPTNAPTTTPSPTSKPTKAPATCSRQFQNIDFHGDDLGYVHVSSAAECCAKCGRTPQCKAFTVIRDGYSNRLTCYLKHGQGSLRNKRGAVSGIVDSARQYSQYY